VNRAELQSPTDLGANANRDIPSRAGGSGGGRLRPLPQDEELPLAHIGRAEFVARSQVLAATQVLSTPLTAAA
jgi:hypothetical protein